MTLLNQLMDRALTILSPQDLGRSLFLFPSKRAALFFTRTLQQSPRCPDPLLMPEQITLSDWTIRQINCQAASWETLLLTLFKSYSALAGTSGLSFEHFYPHAQAILNDLIDIDRGLLTHRQITELAQAAQNSDSRNSSFSAVLDLLPDLHGTFSQSLLQQAQVHDALALRSMLSRKGALESAVEQYAAVFTCGFYPIDSAEIELFFRLNRHPQAHLIWDTDRYFVDQPGQEAGLFFKRPDLFPDHHETFDTDLQDRARSITLIDTQGTIDQAKALEPVFDLLRTAAEPAEEIAILLPQEGLLLPLLSAVPDCFDKINITMGYPLAQSLPVSFLHGIQDLHRQMNDTDDFIPFMPLYRLLRHPEWAPFLSPDIQTELHKARTLQCRSVRRQDARAWAGPLEPFLTPPADPRELFGLILQLLDKMKSTIPAGDEESAPAPRLELLYQIRRQVLTADRIINDPELDISIKTAWLILWECIQQGAIPFSGEPLEGLQIMGMLESRCLDFRNIVILSFNEGVYPRSRPAFSLIPGEIRKQYRIAGQREHDARDAYQFYRLLKRSRNVWLVYDGSGRNETGSEPSRFIRQIEHEFCLHCPGTTLNRASRVHTAPALIHSSLSLPNTMDFQKIWRTMSFSASAINMYLGCPLSFVLRYGLKIHEKPRAADESDPRGIGQIAHECLEQLYLPLLDQSITPELIEAMRPRLDELIKESSQKHYPGLDISRGRPYLESHIQQELLHRLLDAQKSEPPYILESVERHLHGRVELPDGSSFDLKGFVDRIDRLEDGWRIVDYKSGTLPSSELNLKEMPEEFQDNSPFNSKKLAWQLLFYQQLFCQNEPVAPEQVQCALLSLRKPADGFLGFRNADGPAELHTRFRRQLEGFFTRLNDPATLFGQTEDKAVCRNCSYQDICHR